MTKIVRTKQDPVTGSIKQPIAWLILIVPIFFGVFVFAAIFMPTYGSRVVSAAVSLGLMGITTSFWLNFKPNLILKFMNLISMTGLWLIIAIRAFGYIWPHTSLLMGFLITITVFTAHLIPILDSKLTWFLRAELASTSPKTRVGGYILKISLAIAPLSGFIGAAIGFFLSNKRGEMDIIVVLAGPLFWFLAIILPFSSAHPVSPLEKARE